MTTYTNFTIFYHISRKTYYDEFFPLFQNTKVFVGSLPAGSKPEELRRLFENFGVVTECDIMNKCGFVWMQTEEMAQSAIAALNNTMFNGQSIVVEQGRMKDRGQKRQSGGGPGGSRGGGFQRGGQGGMGRQGLNIF